MQCLMQPKAAISAGECLPKVSVLIPTFMERDNVTSLIQQINKNLSGHTFEIVVIDDNSSDGTADVVRGLIEDYRNTKLLVRSEKKGLGSAYRDGLKAASYDFIVEMDADLSHNPEDITKLLDGLKYGDIVIGSRYIKDGHIVGWNWRRRLVSWGANRFVRLVLRLEPKDVTSGFRVYNKKAFEQVASRSKLNGYAFQVEVLYLANKLGFKIQEVPITFKDRQVGRSKLGFPEIMRFALTVFLLRFRKIT